MPSATAACTSATHGFIPVLLGCSLMPSSYPAPPLRTPHRARNRNPCFRGTGRGRPGGILPAKHKCVFRGGGYICGWVGGWLCVYGCVCVCVCVCVCACVAVCGCMCVCGGGELWLWLCVAVCVHVHVRVRVRVCVCERESEYLSGCICPTAVMCLAAVLLSHTCPH